MGSAPVYPARRSCSAVRVAASPPPTITIPLPPALVVIWSSYTIVAGRGRSPLGPRPVDEVGQHDNAFRAFDVGAGANALQRIFEMPHVVRKHPQYRVGGPGRRRGTDHLGNVYPCPAQLVRRNSAVAVN